MCRGEGEVRESESTLGGSSPLDPGACVTWQGARTDFAAASDGSFLSLSLPLPLSLCLSAPFVLQTDL